AAIADRLARQTISIESMMQRARAEGDVVPVVIVTHETTRAAMERALADIATLDVVSGAPCLLSIENF
ncbi:MAG: homoserine dehydrogenase, partial [Pseudomonadota bacterium]